MAELSSEQVQQYNSTLEGLLTQERAESYRLPGLVKEDNFLDRWLKKFNDWFDRETRVTPDPMNIDWAGIATFLEALLVVGLVLLVVWLGYRLWQSHKGKTRRTKLAPGIKKIEDTRDQYLLGEIDKSLANGDWRLAGRLRWKLFLKRLKDDPFLTPREYRHRLASQAIPWNLALFDEVMFGKRPIGTEEYRMLDASLAVIETEAKRAA